MGWVKSTEWVPSICPIESLLKMRQAIQMIIRSAAAVIAVTSMAAAHAGAPDQPFRVQLDTPIGEVFIGNSIGWLVSVHDDRRVVTVMRNARYATATNMIFVTPGGLATYDIARDGRVELDTDRRIMPNNGTLELAPVRVSVLEFPGEVKRVEWTRPLALQVQAVIDHHYVALKYAPMIGGPTISGPRRLTVTTDSGTYSFNLVAGTDGAPVYRVSEGN